MVAHARQDQDRLEPGFLGSTDEKAVTQRSGSLPAQYSSREEASKERMSPPRRLALTVLVCFLATFSLASVLHHSKGLCLNGEKRTGDEGTAPNLMAQDEASESGFPQLLRGASPDILHRLLHAYFPSRYRHGVYPSDHDALVAVHRDNPPLASSLARLAKRQDGGTNSTGTSTPGSSSNPPSSTPSSTPTPDPPAPDPDTSSNNPPPTDNPGGNSNPPSNNTPDPTPDPKPTNEPDTPGTSPEGEQTDEPSAALSDEPSTSSDSPSPSTSEPSQASPKEDSSSNDDIETTPSHSPIFSPSSPTPMVTPDKPKETPPPKASRTPSRSASLITKTSTDAEGHLIIVTSTSYYNIYPTEETDTADSASLQNAGSRVSSESLLSALLGIAVGGFLLN